MNRLIVILIWGAFLTGCSRQKGGSTFVQSAENHSAKQQMQGVWIDPETEDIAFRVSGDSLFYADSTSLPAYFMIIGDSLVLGSGTKYCIARQSENLLWIRNQNGDLIKFSKSDNPEDVKEFVYDPPKVMVYTHQVKTDSVVNFGGERYHWYIAINPTKYKVVRHTFNDDGMEVSNVYYDNIMHISVYRGAQCLYSSDFRKQHYAGLVPEKFLVEAVLADMVYSQIDSKGLHFNATICIPDGASCYMVETTVDYDGKTSMSLIEY